MENDLEAAFSRHQRRLRRHTAAREIHRPPFDYTTLWHILNELDLDAPPHPLK